MSKPDALRDLASDRLIIRRSAVLRLQHSYDEETGESVVNALLIEPDPSLFAIMTVYFASLWTPRLDRRLSDLDYWPFSGARTLFLLDQTRRHPLRSPGRFIGDWTDASSWEFRFAALRWTYNSRSVDDGYAIARHLLDEIHEFRVSEEVLTAGDWIRKFANLDDRVAELKEVIDLAEGRRTGG